MTASGGNSIFQVYTPSATPGGAVTYSLTSTVVVVGVNLLNNVTDVSINGAF